MSNEISLIIPFANTLYIIEMIIFLVTFPFNILLFIMLIKISTIPSDLKALMLSFPCSFYIIIITRCLLIINHLNKQSTNIMIQSIHDSAIVYFSIGFIGIGIERILATLSFHERKKPFLLGGFLVSLQLVISSAINAWRSFFHMDYVTFNVLVTACNILSLGAFPVLWTINKKCYQNSQKNRHLHTLADRYHIKENLSTIHSLIYLATVNAVVIFSTSAIMFYLNFGLNELNDDKRRLISRYAIHAFNLLIAIYTFVFPLTAIYTNACLYKKLPKCHIGNANKIHTPNLTRADDMTIKAKVETDTYFHNLQNLWTKDSTKN